MRLIKEVQKGKEAVWQYCPRGGQMGWFITIGALKDFARSNGLDYVDEVIPIPDPELSFTDSHDHDRDVVYWETDKGTHGWCCSRCGTVVQWG